MKESVNKAFIILFALIVEASCQYFYRKTIAQTYANSISSSQIGQASQFQSEDPTSIASYYFMCDLYGWAYTFRLSGLSGSLASVQLSTGNFCFVSQSPSKNEH